MNSIYKTGIYYGYPSCCIKEFIKDYSFMLKHTISEELVLKRKVSNGSGFIPCFQHAKQIEAGEIKLEDLILDRKHVQLFPKGYGKPVQSQN